MTQGKWPNSFDFLGFNAPIGEEWSVENLEVEGIIPSEIDGSFFRAGADPQFAPFVEEDTFLSGDGMVSRFRITGNKVDFAIRYIETERFLAEKAAGRPLFGAYRNPYTDDPSVQKTDRTVANTTPVWHAGRLLLTKEDGLPYQIDPETLATLGRFDFGGKLKSETFTAHTRIDPKTGEMFAFGYEATGMASKDVSYWIVSRDGAIVSEQFFKAPYCSMMHDFVVTENWAVFPVFPTIADLDRIKAGGAHWVHHQDVPCWVGIMPRYGDVADMKWVKGPDGVSAFHFMNGFEEQTVDGRTLIHFDHSVMETNIFPFIRAASGIDASPAEIRAEMVRWTIDLSDLSAGWTEEPMGPPGDMPRTAAKDQCYPYDYGYYACYDPSVGPPHIHSVVGAGFNTLIRLNARLRAITAMPLGPDRSINEPIHIPAQDAAHEGWLAAVVDTHSLMSSELWLIEAANIPAGAIAKVSLGRRLRPQIHGCWVPRELQP